MAKMERYIEFDDHVRVRLGGVRAELAELAGLAELAARDDAVPWEEEDGVLIKRPVVVDAVYRKAKREIVLGFFPRINDLAVCCGLAR